MLPSGVLFVLFLGCCWLYCLTDAALTPTAEFPGLLKRAWIVFIAVAFAPGAIAWLIARRTWRARHWPLTAAGQLASYDSTNVMWYPDRPPAPADAALARHPASRSRKSIRPGRTAPIGPDDDP
jgi:hypothetical protein